MKTLRAGFFNVNCRSIFRNQRVNLISQWRKYMFTIQKSIFSTIIKCRRYKFWYFFLKKVLNYFENHDKKFFDNHCVINHTIPPRAESFALPWVPPQPPKKCVVWILNQFIICFSTALYSRILDWLSPTPQTTLSAKY